MLFGFSIFKYLMLNCVDYLFDVIKIFKIDFLFNLLDQKLEIFELQKYSAFIFFGEEWN